MIDPSERILPHNLEAEKAVLGAVLINNAQLDRLAGVIRAGDFFRHAHRMIYEIAFELHERRVEVDLVTVKDEATRRGELEELGGPAYISSLTDGVPHSANATYYAAIVREMATRRRCIDVGDEMLVAAYDGETRSSEIVATADKAIIELQRGAEPGRMVDLRTTAGELYGWIEKRVELRGQLTGVTTGFPSLDELTLGWQAGDMIVVAARPSIGKTALILNNAIATARTGKRVAIFSLEMRTRQLQGRMLAHLAALPLRRIMAGHLAPDDFTKLAEAMGVMHELPIYVDDRGGQSIWDIRAACRRLRLDEGGLGLVIIDYLQLMPGTLDRRGATRNDEMTDISRRTKVLADECSVPILALSQLNRGADSRTDKTPQLSDLRESGSLEQDADIVLFLHRKNHRASGPTAAILGKQRNGPTGTVTLTFDRETQTFADAGLEPEEVPLPDAGPAEQKPRPPRGWRR
jgi:replicative DNA helicase